MSSVFTKELLPYIKHPSNKIGNGELFYVVSFKVSSAFRVSLLGQVGLQISTNI